MSVIDGRTGETRNTQASLPQDLPVSPVLFILSVGAMFQWLEDRHPVLQAISFVDDKGLLIDCEGLDKGTRSLSVSPETCKFGATL